MTSLDAVQSAFAHADRLSQSLRSLEVARHHLLAMQWPDQDALLAVNRLVHELSAEYEAATLRAHVAHERWSLEHDERFRFQGLPDE